MEQTRNSIIDISKNEKQVKKLLILFRKGELSEDELISKTIESIHKDLVYYRNELLNNEASIW